MAVSWAAALAIVCSLCALRSQVTATTTTCANKSAWVNSCFHCGNRQTCDKERVLKLAKSKEECCQLASLQPLPPIHLPINGMMWSWDIDNNNCTVYLGDDPELYPGNCVSGFLHSTAPPPTPPIHPPPTNPKNILYIAIDDLRPELAGGCVFACVRQAIIVITAFVRSLIGFNRIWCLQVRPLDCSVPPFKAICRRVARVRARLLPGSFGCLLAPFV